MATNFPTSLDSLTNPAAGDSLSSPSHSAQHANVNDAVEALQAKVGVDGSAVTGSLDYKVANQGLTLVKTTAVGSGLSSVTVTGAFSSTFRNYRIVWDGWIASSTQAIELEFGAGGTHTTGYYGVSTKRAFDTGVVDTAYNNTTPMVVAYGTGVAGRAYLVVEVSNPQTTRYTSFFGASSQERGTFFTGMYNAGTQFTSFTFQPQSGTITGGYIRVYGYNDG